MMNFENEVIINPVPTLKEAHDNLHASLGDKVFAQYNALMKQFFNLKINKLKFDEEARKLLTTNDQIHLHNMFLLSMSDKIQPVKTNPTYLNSDENNPEDGETFGAQERCIPADELIKTRLLITAFQHDLEGADDDVTKVIVLAVQLFLKNILTAVVSKCSGYKIRENTFQHAIGFPVADPWLRNYKNIVDDTQESNLEVNEDDQNIHPVVRNTLETVQQQAAFSYSCASTGNISTQKCIGLKELYETLLENPGIISNHTIHSINLERILSKLDTL